MGYAFSLGGFLAFQSLVELGGEQRSYRCADRSAASTDASNALDSSRA
jgi:hypothetical protein